MTPHKTTANVSANALQIFKESIIVLLENYQALHWWIFQTDKFLREKATHFKWNIEVAHVEEKTFEWGTIFCETPFP